MAHWTYAWVTINSNVNNSYRPLCEVVVGMGVEVKNSNHDLSMFSAVKNYTPSNWHLPHTHAHTHLYKHTHTHARTQMDAHIHIHTNASIIILQSTQCHNCQSDLWTIQRSDHDTEDCVYSEHNVYYSYYYYYYYVRMSLLSGCFARL